MAIKKAAKKAAKKTTRGAKKAPAKKPSEKRKVSPIPRGYRTVTPYLNQNDATATIAFCKKAFGATLKGKMMGPGKKIMHAELTVGDSMIMLSDAVGEPAQEGSIFLYVENVDKTVAKAVKAGATVIMPATDMFWGDRFARLRDPQGNLWSLGARVEIVSPAEMKKRTKAEAKRMKAQMG